MAAEKTEKVKANPILVVGQLPKVDTRVALGDDGNEYDLVTAEEALTEILITVRELKKGLL